MKPPKRRIPTIIKEDRLKGVMCKEHVTKAEIYSKFQETENLVLYELLGILLNREPLMPDIELIELEQYTGEETGSNVYYCGVKIGRLILGGPGDMLESIIKLENIFFSFYPDEEYQYV